MNPKTTGKEISTKTSKNFNEKTTIITFFVCLVKCHINLVRSLGGISIFENLIGSVKRSKKFNLFLEKYIIE